MSFAMLIRWAGLASFFAGVLIALAEIIHPVGEYLGAVYSPLWPPAHGLWWLGVVLLQFGLFGLYACHVDALGWLGFAGFGLAFFGTSLTAGILFIQTGAVPPIATSSPALANELLYGPVFWVLLNEACFGGGFILFAVATRRAVCIHAWQACL